MISALVVGANRLHREAVVAQLGQHGLDATGSAVDELPGDGDGCPVLVLAHELAPEQAELLADWLTGRAHVILGQPRQLPARSALRALRVAAPADVEELVELLRRARPADDEAVPAAAPAGPLTSRELDVLRLIALGAGNTEIAGELAISAHTVRTHAQNILGKLGVSNRFAAVATARSAGMLEPARSR